MDRGEILTALGEIEELAEKGYQTLNFDGHASHLARNRFTEIVARAKRLAREINERPESTVTPGGNSDEQRFLRERAEEEAWRATLSDPVLPTGNTIEPGVLMTAPSLADQVAELFDAVLGALPPGSRIVFYASDPN